MLDEKLSALAVRCRELLYYVEAETQSIRREIESAKGSWPAAQMAATDATDWHNPSEPTPAGTVIWATDGSRVWTIWGTGKPINKEATAVKAWSVAFIPAPPASMQVVVASTTQEP